MKTMNSSPVKDLRPQAQSESPEEPALHGLPYQTAPLLPIHPTGSDVQVRRKAKGNGGSYERVVSEWWWI